MELSAEATWRKALEVRGKDWVRAELQRRPGHPDDIVYDVVFEEPYPTRAFCHDWCIEQDNQIFRVSWQTPVMVLILVVAVVCGFAGVSGVMTPPDTPRAGGNQAMNSGRYASPGPSQAIYDDPLKGDAGGGISDGSQSLPSVCGYQSYQTSECNTGQ